MTLFWATVITAILLMVIGGVLILKVEEVNRWSQWFLRGKWGGGIFFGTGVLWFLYEVSQLGPEDFGQYKYLFLIFFSVLGLLSFKYIPDFLSVRGLSILGLLYSGVMLEAAYMTLPLSRLFLVVLMYGVIISSLYMAAVPYKVRDFLDWLYGNGVRIRVLGSGLLVYGVLLGVVALTY